MHMQGMNKFILNKVITYYIEQSYYFPKKLEI